MKRKTKLKLNFAYFGLSGFLRKACSETLGQGSYHKPAVFHMLRLLWCNAIYANENWKREVSLLAVYHHLGKYNEFQARSFWSDVLYDKMKMDHDPLSKVATQPVLKFMESLGVSRKVGLKKLWKICKQEVPTFF